MLTLEQIVSGPKAQLAAIATLGNQAFDGIEQFATLNLNLGKAALADSIAYWQSLIDARSPQDLLSAQSTAAQPLAERVASYSRQLYEIASNSGSGFNRLASAQAADAQKQFSAALDDALKSAPQGSEPAAAMVRNAVTTANAAMESMQKVVRQATEMTEANLKSLAEGAAKTAPKRD